MIELKKKPKGLRPLRPFDFVSNGESRINEFPSNVVRPSVYPKLLNESVVCGYDQGLGERLFSCETLEDMQSLFDSYAGGGALQINWYAAIIKQKFKTKHKIKEVKVKHKKIKTEDIDKFI